MSKLKQDSRQNIDPVKRILRILEQDNSYFLISQPPNNEPPPPAGTAMNPRKVNR